MAKGLRCILLIGLLMSITGFAMNFREKVNAFESTKSGFGQLTIAQLFIKCIESKIILPTRPFDEQGKIKIEIKKEINTLSEECKTYIDLATKFLSNVESSNNNKEVYNVKTKKMLQEYREAITMANFTAPQPEDVDVVEEIEYLGNNATNSSLRLRLKKK